MSGMIRRLYVHNYRCLENFELSLADRPAVLLIGKNGSGKTTVLSALEVLQRIARGTNRIGDLAKPRDFPRGKADAPMRFEIEAQIGSDVFQYGIALEFPEGFKELRVREEKLSINGQPAFGRELSLVHLPVGPDKAADFRIDWHLAALPVIQARNESDPIGKFKRWLEAVLILNPVPTMLSGDSSGETLQPDRTLQNYGDWFTGVMTSAPSAYTRIDSFLKQLMPDLRDIKNPPTGSESRSLVLQFSNSLGTVNVPFRDLSDGEKCFMICALLLAANDANGPLVCVWDEPDSHLALSEVGHLIQDLRGSLQSGGQFIATSHNPEAIRRFSDENTLLLFRKSHLEPTQVRPLSDLQLGGDLVDGLIRDDIEP